MDSQGPLCTRCGVRPADVGYRRCGHCRQLNAANKKVRRERLQAQFSRSRLDELSQQTEEVGGYEAERTHFEYERTQNENTHAPMQPVVRPSNSPDSANQQQQRVAEQPISVHKQPTSPDGDSETPGPAWLEYAPRTPQQTPQRVQPRESKVTRIVAIADTHYPFEDKRADAVARAVTKDIKPDVFAHLGDLGQWESCSHFRKKAPRDDELSAEYYAVNVALDAWEEATEGAKRYLLEGNHSDWIAQAAAMYGPMRGLLDIQEGLYLKRGDYWRSSVQLRDWTWVPMGQQPFRIGQAGFSHGAGYEGIYHTKRIADEYCPAHKLEITFTGHNHTTQVASSKTGGMSVSVPWLGDGTQPVFRYGGSFGKPNGWRTGLIYIEVPDSGPVAWQHIHINNGVATYGGRRYCG